jgi:hypothetical protein
LVSNLDAVLHFIAVRRRKLRPIFTQKLTASYALSILNIIYAIFLGLLFTYFFKFDLNPETKIPEVSVMLTSNNWEPLCLLGIYFILDLLTTNRTVAILKKINPLLLFCLIVLIAYLGSMVVLAFDINKTVLYPMFAIYALIVSFYDIMLWKLNTESYLVSIVILIIALSRLAIGLVMFISITLTIVFKTAELSAEANRGSLIAFIFAFVVDKFIRFFVYEVVAGKLLEGN